MTYVTGTGFTTAHEGASKGLLERLAWLFRTYAQTGPIPPDVDTLLGCCLGSPKVLLLDIAPLFGEPGNISNRERYELAQLVAMALVTWAMEAAPEYSRFIVHSEGPDPLGQRTADVVMPAARTDPAKTAQLIDGLVEYWQKALKGWPGSPNRTDTINEILAWLGEMRAKVQPATA